MMRRLSGFSTLLALAAVTAISPWAAAPAQADSFFFGVSGGDRYRHHRHGPWHHHGYHRHSYWSGYHGFYRPPVIVAPPPVVYRAAPPVVYSAPVYSAPPVVSAVPSSPVYQAPNGQYCREYQGTVVINGRTQPSYGTACLMPDGSWRVAN